MTSFLYCLPIYVNLSTIHHDLQRQSFGKCTFLKAKKESYKLHIPSSEPKEEENTLLPFYY